MRWSPARKCPRKMYLPALSAPPKPTARATIFWRICRWVNGDLDRKNRVPEAVSRITLDATEKGRQDFALAVGTVATVATVQAAAPLLSTEDSSIGTVVDNKYVTEYPLLLRSWDDLVNLVAGVQGQRYTDQGGSTSAGRTGGFNVHGIRQLENNFLLDGMDNNSISENVQELTTQVARPSVDALQEFKIITNPYSAEYSRGGAVISVISKGGTNEYHGTLYEYLRNRDTDANDFSFPTGRASQSLRTFAISFGGNLGGPIKKNKLFAFFDEESTRIITGQLRSGTVPVDTERVGNFSVAAGAAVHTTYPTIYQDGAPVPNNIIPSSSVSPVASSIMALFPQPTVAGAELNNYFRNADLTDNTDRYSTRVDWQASDNDTVFHALHLEQSRSQQSRTFPWHRRRHAVLFAGKISFDRRSRGNRLDAAHQRFSCERIAHWLRARQFLCAAGAVRTIRGQPGAGSS